MLAVYAKRESFSVFPRRESSLTNILGEKLFLLLYFFYACLCCSCRRRRFGLILCHLFLSEDARCVTAFFTASARAVLVAKLQCVNSAKGRGNEKCKSAAPRLANSFVFSF